MIICLLGVTLRYEDICEPGMIPQYHTPPPLIYAFWHRCLLACAWRFRNGNLHILISRSFDGELIARTVERLGFVAVRGSSSRDGAVGLRNMQRAYLDEQLHRHHRRRPPRPRHGRQARRQPSSRNSVNTPVGAVYLHPHRAWKLRSWDRFLIPKPFSRVTVAWTVPVPADQQAVQAALDRSVELAESDRLKIVPNIDGAFFDDCHPTEAQRSRCTAFHHRTLITNSPLKLT